MKKLHNWNECIKQGIIDKVKIDTNKIKALQKVALQRIKVINLLPVNEETASIIFENYYTSILELTHTLALQKGFKINNHHCISYFIQEVINKTELAEKFELCRIERNRLVYYGQEIRFSKVKNLIKTCKEIVKTIP